MSRIGSTPATAALVADAEIRIKHHKLRPNTGSILHRFRQ
jgi:hypothetical protein